MPVQHSYRSIDEYLSGLPADRRDTLEGLRRQILRLIPDATEVISYGLPSFKWNGKVVVGFAANKSDFSLYPFSGSAGVVFGNELKDRMVTKGSIHFTAENPIPPDLLRRIVEWRKETIAGA